MMTACVAFSVMITVCSCVNQFPTKICFYGFIGIPGRACTQFNSLSFESSLCTASDAAANNNINSIVSEQIGQSAMSAAVGIDNLRRYYFSVPDLINLKGFCM